MSKLMLILILIFRSHPSTTGPRPLPVIECASPVFQNSFPLTHIACLLVLPDNTNELEGLQERAMSIKFPPHVTYREAFGTDHQKTYRGRGSEVQKKYSRKGKLKEKKFMHAN